MREKNIIYNEDCLNALKEFPNNYFDLVLTDPPYAHGKSIISSSQKDKYDSSWDVEINKEIYYQIIRISKNQIIFGGEHLSNNLPKSRGWYVWDKRLRDCESNDFSDGELIWTSFNQPLRILRYLWNGFRVELKEKRFNHPTQKPLNLIIKLLKKHTNKGDLILDCFMGSGTTAVACKSINRDFIGFEINKKYVDIANERLKQEGLNNFIK